MQITTTKIPHLLIIQPKVIGDHRGWFMESWSERAFKANGIDISFVQDNHSFSAKRGTLRGLHFQNDPMSQSKLLRCTKGAILDVAVDIRKGSPTFGKWISVELTEENKKMVLIPQGFAHGFLTLTDNVEVQYKADQLYSKEHDRSIKFNDPLFNVDWGIKDPILSEKDINAPLFNDSDANFIYKS